MDRPLLNTLGEYIDRCVQDGGIVIAVLPTGYGKTSFVREKLIDEIVKGSLRVVHALPLRAIVAQTASAAKRRAEQVSRGRSDVVGYQAGIVVEDVDKAPYMSRHYMVTTIDSLLLSFYGIPVYEMMRAHWHSDVAYVLARSFDILILDEFHLMVSGEGVESTKETDLIAKQLESIARLVSDYLSMKKCVAILTATLPPTLISALLERVVNALDSGRALHLYVVGFGVRDNAYWKRFIEELSKNNRINIECMRIEIDSSFEPCSSIKTLVVKVGMVNHRGVKVPELVGVLNVIRRELGPENIKKVRRVFIAFNSWRRAVAAYELFGRLVEEMFDCRAYLMTGKMPPRDRARVLKAMEDESLCLFATQVVEAGIDVDFDVLISEAAPLPALAQRAGRVSRYGKPGSENAIAVLVDEDGRADPFVRGIYDADIANKSIELIRSCLKSTDFGWAGLFEWRCVSTNCCDIQCKLGELDALYSSVRNAMASASVYEDELAKLMFFTHPPRYVVEALDKAFDGSFIRKTALIPLIPEEVVEEAISNSNGVLNDKSLRKILGTIIAVDTAFLRRYGESVLRTEESEEKKSKVVATVFLVKTRRGNRLEIVYEARLRELCERPMYTMWRLTRRFSSRDEPWMLVGFLLKKGTYREGLGMGLPIGGSDGSR